MSELVSSVEIKKADGKNITFNFQFENGLPVKPLINVKREIWVNNDNLYGITAMISEDDIRNISSLNVKNISWHDTNDSNIKNIWIHLEECYLVIKNIEKLLLEKMLKQKLLLTFVDNNNNQLN